MEMFNFRLKYCLVLVSCVLGPVFTDEGLSLSYVFTF